VNRAGAIAASILDPLPVAESWGSTRGARRKEARHAVGPTAIPANGAYYLTGAPLPIKEKPFVRSFIPRACRSADTGFGKQTWRTRPLATIAVCAVRRKTLLSHRH